jgi:hypothetical protein
MATPFAIPPAEPVQLMLLHLPPRQIIRTCATDQYLRQLCQAESFWRAVLDRYYPHLLVHGPARAAIRHILSYKLITLYIDGYPYSLNITGDMSVGQLEELLQENLADQPHTYQVWLLLRQAGRRTIVPAEQLASLPSHLPLVMVSLVVDQPNLFDSLEEIVAQSS